MNDDKWTVLTSDPASYPDDCNYVRLTYEDISTGERSVMRASHNDYQGTWEDTEGNVLVNTPIAWMPEPELPAPYKGAAG